MLNNTQKLYFEIFIDFHYGTDLPDEIIRHIIDFVKYDKLTNHTIRLAVQDYCSDNTANFKKKKREVLFVYGPMKYWNVSSVTRLFRTFGDLKNFNEDISEWDVSQVTTMYETFKNAKHFRGDLSRWDVGNVVTMYGMFHGASCFNSDLSEWNVSNVKFMENMFRGAVCFKGYLSDWDVSNVETMNCMFFRASSFNANLSSWQIWKVRTMGQMFFEARSFSHELSDWENKIKNNLYCAQMFKGSRVDDDDLPLWYKQMSKNSHTNWT